MIATLINTIIKKNYDILNLIFSDHDNPIQPDLQFTEIDICSTDWLMNIPPDYYEQKSANIIKSEHGTF